MELSPKYELAVFSSAYCGSVDYYATMLNAKKCVIDASERELTSHWAHNHMRICGANGEVVLTVPIEKASANRFVPMHDVRISEHGNWRHLHWGALFSAYGKSPFFDYIAPDLQRIIMGEQKHLLDLNMQLHELIVDFLDLPITTEVRNYEGDTVADFRHQCGEKAHDAQRSIVAEYYQMRLQKFGFMPNLSILDLLCNCGREAIFSLLTK